MRESDKPDLVIYLAVKSNHSSRDLVAKVLKRFTLEPPGAGVYALFFLLQIGFIAPCISTGAASS